ncbi:MAG: hypothetical protein GX837_06000 [Methanomicrobiales archaeon]|nr:hypothetical protein [Methanomicrobiales archaeon]
MCSSGVFSSCFAMHAGDHRTSTLVVILLAGCCEFLVRGDMEERNSDRERSPLRVCLRETSPGRYRLTYRPPT